MNRINVFGQLNNYECSLTVGNTTLGKVLVPAQGPLVMAAATGETTPPGLNAAAQRVLTGSARVTNLVCATTDTVANNVRLYKGAVLTLYANMTSAVISATNVLTRGGGSFLTDGWTIGDTVMLFGSTAAANNGALAQITAITATVMTVTGTPWTNETSTATLYVVKVTQRYYLAIPASSGNTAVLPNVPLLGPNLTLDKSVDITGISLGPAGTLIVALAANASALPARFDFSAELGDQ